MLLISKTISTLFGIGFIKFIPGTLGSILTVIIWFFTCSFFGKIYFFSLFFIIFFSSYYLLKNYLTVCSEEDPSEVVIDEFIGISIPLLFVSSNNSYYEILLVFVCFRIFDIIKIYPANKAERINGPIGIILDDIIAGIYSLIILLVYQIVSSTWEINYYKLKKDVRS